MRSQRRIGDAQQTNKGAPRTVELEDWAVHHPDDPYRAPEQRGFMVSGMVVRSNSRKFKVGQRIITSCIVQVEGRTLRTETGSFYLLVGDPTESYARWLAQKGIKYDRRRPIILHTGKTKPGGSRPS